jgi:hypothetical protein
MLPTVSFGYDRPEEFEARHGRLWPQAAQLLTGLTMEQISDLGGLLFYNPLTDEVIWEWIPEPKWSIRQLTVGLPFVGEAIG